MNTVLAPASMFRLVWRRLRSRLWLTLAVWAGLALAVGLVTSIPIYAEATGYRILTSALAKDAQDDPLPPFSLVYRYEATDGPALTWRQYKAEDKDAADLPSSALGLLPVRSVRYAATEKLSILTPGGGETAFSDVPQARLAFLSDLRSNIQLVDGTMPRPYTGNGPLDVLVTERDASVHTFLVDDIYTLHTTVGTAYDLGRQIRIAGIWRPSNPNSDYWFYPPSTFTSTLLVPEESFSRVLDDPRVPWVSFTAWYMAPDTRTVHSAEVAGLRQSIGDVTDRLTRMLPGMELARSPVDALEKHGQQVRLLTITLALFAIPLLGLVWLFVVQVARMLVESQRQEMALLRSRGVSRPLVILLILGEGTLIGVAGLLAGLLLAVLTAQVMVWTQAFLQIVPRPGPPVELLPSSWQVGTLVILLALPAVLIPALGASRYTIISFKQERSRTSEKPLWKRAYLDLLLLGVALYGYQQLRQRGSVDLPGTAAAADDPWRNPVLLLAPALLA
ncbi:MAG: FtsX-like permease family protein, partial [Chloroflexota bacterium]|nr:FtsX-like permease family protein [Chloroflexota bacterium]